MEDISGATIGQMEMQNGAYFIWNLILSVLFLLIYRCRPIVSYAAELLSRERRQVAEIRNEQVVAGKKMNAVKSGWGI
jgi:hypothetical protein